VAPESRTNAAEIDRLATTLAKDPASKAFIPLAEEYGKAGMWSEAAGVLEDGLTHYPGFITAMVALGRAYDQLSQPTKAKAILEEAIKISPENLRAHRTLAKIYTAEGSTAEALRSCDVILAINPLDQESLSLRASLGATTPTSPEATKTAVGNAPLVSPQSTGKPSLLPPSRVAEFLPPISETTAAASFIKSAIPDVVTDATATITTALELNQTQTQARSLLDDVVTTPSVPEQAASPSQSRNQATIHRLEQILRSIQTRRRDRPSQETIATFSES